MALLLVSQLKLQMFNFCQQVDLAISELDLFRGLLTCLLCEEV